jgi:hypothetical protein
MGACWVGCRQASLFASTGWLSADCSQAARRGRLHSTGYSLLPAPHRTAPLDSLDSNSLPCAVSVVRAGNPWKEGVAHDGWLTTAGPRWLAALLPAILPRKPAAADAASRCGCWLLLGASTWSPGVDSGCCVARNSGQPKQDITGTLSVPSNLLHLQRPHIPPLIHRALLAGVIHDHHHIPPLPAAPFDRLQPPPALRIRCHLSLGRGIVLCSKATSRFAPHSLHSPHSPRPPNMQVSRPCWRRREGPGRCPWLGMAVAVHL